MKKMNKIMTTKFDLYKKSKNSSLTEKSTQFQYWSEKWFCQKKVNVKESTFARYLNLYQCHIKKEFDDKQINEIDSEFIDGYIYRMRTTGRTDNKGGLSPKTVQDILIVVKGIIKFAIAHGVVYSHSLECFGVKQERQSLKILTVSEEEKLVRFLANNPNEIKVGILICLYTGIRIGEICALKWKNISTDDKTISIEHTLQRIKLSDNDNKNNTRIIISEPKSASSKRIIPLPPSLLELIKNFQKDEEAFFLSGTKYRFIEPRTLQNHFKKYLNTININNYNFHILRHTFATRCVELGFDIKTLSEILGHSSVRITLDKYVHSSIQQKRNNMNKIQIKF